MVASPTILRIGLQRSRPRTWRSTSILQTWVASMATTRIFRGECERFARYDTCVSEVAMSRSAVDRIVLVPVLAVSVALLLPSATAAQGTPADYARAQKLRATYESLAVDIASPATAIGNTHRFWYRKTVRSAEQFVVVDADTQQRQPAFNHENIAAS